jgi:hypothetical protein
MAIFTESLLLFCLVFVPCVETIGIPPPLIVTIILDADAVVNCVQVLSTPHFNASLSHLELSAGFVLINEGLYPPHISECSDNSLYLALWRIPCIALSAGLCGLLEAKAMRSPTEGRLSGIKAALNTAANAKGLASCEAFPTDTRLPELPGGCLYPSGSPEKNEGVCQ